MKLSVFPKIVVFIFTMTTFVSGAVVKFCVLEDSFLGKTYKTTLYDIKSLFNGALSKCSFCPPSDCSVFSLVAKVDAYDKIKSFEGRCIDVSKALGDERGIYFEGRVFDSFDHLNEYNAKSFAYDLKFVTKSEKIKNDYTQTIYNRDLGVVPIICRKCGIGVHDRANLYDMFSAQVDDYLLSYGVAERIVHENEDKTLEQQLQVSVFGSIEMPEMHFFQIGFFQYTFNGEGHCYHRAFKPWTVECLKHLSNAKTQVILRSILLDWLKSLPNTPEYELYRKMELYHCYDSSVTILSQACAG